MTSFLFAQAQPTVMPQLESGKRAGASLGFSAPRALKGVPFAPRSWIWLTPLAPLEKRRRQEGLPVYFFPQFLVLMIRLGMRVSL